ncbi:ribokinase [Oribacterium sp. WCC10]|uniref:ribokinase n=1 Tax=Oribacterium sp. WCC10 TaxID=1855343 RepID=UPI0008EAB188|nr:ribokinase [Oribacterium sp. WCC10]SFG43269.1 ribokinase [Oribacterium sp. WCC10]
MKILNFGSLNVDKVYKVEHFVQPGETISSLEMNTFTGGKGLNQSIAIARAGSSVFHAGAVGDDASMLLHALSSSNVDVSMIRSIDVPTGHAIIQVDTNGQNCILLYGGANMMITKAQIDETLSHFQEGDYLVLQNEISELDYIVDKAYEKHMEIWLNPSPISSQLHKVDLKKVNWLVLNEVEASNLCKNSEVLNQDYTELLYQHFSNSKIVLTLGTKGSIYYDGKNKYVQSAYSVKAIDTTAAGDTFTGYFISSIAQGTPVQDALDFASRASAISVTKRGAAPSIPYKAEVDKFDF